MAITATLTLGKQEYNLTECAYEFYQPIDINNKPSANPKGGLIKFTINSLSDEDLTFHKWMFDKTEKKKGTIEFTLPGLVPGVLDKDHKKVIFEHAYCVGLGEYFTKDIESAQSPASAALETITEVGKTIINPLNLAEKAIGILVGRLTGDSSSSQMLTRVTISAAIIKFKKGEATFTNNELLA